MPGTIKAWNPGVAALLSFLIPGAGQIYKGQIFNGLLWLVVVGIGYLALIIPGAVLHLLCIIGAASGDPFIQDPNAPTPNTHVKCPDCRELVLMDAKVCKHCGCKLIPQSPQEYSWKPEPTNDSNATNLDDMWVKFKSHLSGRAKSGGKSDA